MGGGNGGVNWWLGFTLLIGYGLEVDLIAGCVEKMTRG
jgi:hypothetical protein